MASFSSDTVFGPSNVSEVVPDLHQFRRVLWMFFIANQELAEMCPLAQGGGRHYSIVVLLGQR